MIGHQRLHTMRFIADNANFYVGEKGSPVLVTARKGRKWFDAVEPGDILKLVVDHPDGKVTQIGHAVVMEAELTTFKNVVRNAMKNHGVKKTPK